jgi:hypothetical protein
MLPPALNKAKQKAVATECLSNEHQISLGVAMYRPDYRENYPLTFVDGSTTGGHGYGWFNALQPYVPNTNAFICPSRLHKPGDPTYVWATNKMTAGYGANLQIGGCLFPAAGWKMDPITDAGAARPATTVYVSESGTRATDTADPARCVTLASWRRLNPGSWTMSVGLAAASFPGRSQLGRAKHPAWRTGRGKFPRWPHGIDEIIRVVLALDALAESGPGRQCRRPSSKATGTRWLLNGLVTDGAGEIPAASDNEKTSSRSL